MENDLSLLRPFNLEDVKAGHPVRYISSNDQIKYLAGPDNTDIIAYSNMSNLIYTGHVDAFRMAPLCWMEGKPVYPFDVLYGKMSGQEFIVPNGAFYYDHFTWDKPKVKKTAWINIYPCNNSENRYSTKEIADRQANDSRVACIQITWEE